MKTLKRINRNYPIKTNFSPKLSLWLIVIVPIVLFDKLVLKCLGWVIFRTYLAPLQQMVVGASLVRGRHGVIIISNLIISNGLQIFE